MDNDEYHIIQCPDCATKNKIPEFRLEENPRCGKCGSPLVMDTQNMESEEKSTTNEESIPIFLICIALYFLIGLIVRFTDFFKGPMRWYHIIFAPIGIVGLFMQIYPGLYIKSKLKKWGMFENKADNVAFWFWIGGLILWYYIFVFDPSMD